MERLPDLIRSRYLVPELRRGGRPVRLGDLPQRSAGPWLDALAVCGAGRRLAHAGRQVRQLGLPRPVGAAAGNSRPLTWHSSTPWALPSPTPSGGARLVTCPRLGTSTLDERSVQQSSSSTTAS